MKAIKLLALLLTAVFIVSCGTPRQLASESVKESVIYEGMSSDGGYIVSVVKGGKDVTSASENACRQAVYQTLFKGLVPVSGSFSQRPIVTDPSAEQSHADFFKAFFKSGGGYTKFVRIIPGSQIAPVKTGSGYRVTAKVIVDKNGLRKEMERNGIIQSLSSVFQSR